MTSKSTGLTLLEDDNSNFHLCHPKNESFVDFYLTTISIKYRAEHIGKLQGITLAAGNNRKLSARVISLVISIQKCFQSTMFEKIYSKRNVYAK